MLKGRFVVLLVALAAIAATLVTLRMTRGPGAATVPVTFRIHAPGAATVFVAGTFNQWRAVDYRLDPATDGDWETTIRLAPGRYEYKFLVDTVWVYDSLNPVRIPVGAPGVGFNSFLEVRPAGSDSTAAR